VKKVTPGKRQRSSIAADSSPSCSKMARIAAAQFDRGRQFALLFEHGADRGSIGVGDNEHGERVERNDAPVKAPPCC